MIGVNDEAMLTDAQLNLSAPMGFPVVAPPADRTVAHGETFEAAGLTVKVLEIPGHSPGSVVFLLENASPPIAIVGDVVFAGSVGRADFPGGDGRLLVSGIRSKLFTLPPETIILPGHGPKTTVGREKQFNPYAGDNASVEI